MVVIYCKVFCRQVRIVCLLKFDRMGTHGSAVML